MNVQVGAVDLGDAPAEVRAEQGLSHQDDDRAKRVLALELRDVGGELPLEGVDRS